jgi:hypothetical protein
MRIVDIKEATVPISRYDDPSLPSGGLDSSIVAIVTDVVRNGKPVTGFETRPALRDLLATLH